jgi:gas vesicle protein
MNSGHDNSGSILIAFVLGAIAGAATALLLAPQSGEETRRLISEKARESKDKASEAARRGKEFVDRQREHLSSAIEQGKDAYHRARGTEGEA